MLAAQLIGQGYTDNPYVQSKEGATAMTKLKTAASVSMQPAD